MKLVVHYRQMHGLCLSELLVVAFWCNCLCFVVAVAVMQSTGVRCRARNTCVHIKDVMVRGRVHWPATR